MRFYGMKLLLLGLWLFYSGYAHSLSIFKEEIFKALSEDVDTLITQAANEASRQLNSETAQLTFNRVIHARLPKVVADSAAKGIRNTLKTMAQIDDPQKLSKSFSLIFSVHDVEDQRITDQLKKIQQRIANGLFDSADDLDEVFNVLDTLPNNKVKLSLGWIERDIGQSLLFMHTSLKGLSEDILLDHVPQELAEVECLKPLQDLRKKHPALFSRFDNAFTKMFGEAVKPYHTDYLKPMPLTRKVFKGLFKQVYNVFVDLKFDDAVKHFIKVAF